MIYSWITIDFSVLLYSFIAFIIAYIFLWIRVISVLGSKGWLLLASWIILHVILLRFIYSWNRDGDGGTDTIIIFVLSVLLTLSFLLLTDKMLPPWLLRNSIISLSVLLIIYYFFIERNATLFMSYKMKTEGTFHYPPYSTFKKEVNWNNFFADHQNRQWILEALTTFFISGESNEDAKFRNALFKAWEDYNINHDDKILFTEDGLLRYGRGFPNLTFLCTNENFLVWWIKDEAGSSELQARLIDFLNLVREYIEHTESYNLGINSKDELIQPLLKVRPLISKNAPSLTEAINNLIKSSSKETPISP